LRVDCVSGASAAHGDALLKPKSRYSDLPRVVERPYFDDVSPRNVTAVVGQPAVLNCRVKHIGNRTVSTKIRTTVNLLLLFIIKITSKGWERSRWFLVYVTQEANAAKMKDDFSPKPNNKTIAKTFLLLPSVRRAYFPCDSNRRI